MCCVVSPCFWKWLFCVLSVLLLLLQAALSGVLVERVPLSASFPVTLAYPAEFLFYFVGFACCGHVHVSHMCLPCCFCMSVIWLACVYVFLLIELV
jgi:hypothetical protein